MPAGPTSNPYRVIVPARPGSGQGEYAGEGMRADKSAATKARSVPADTHPAREQSAKADFVPLWLRIHSPGRRWFGRLSGTITRCFCVHSRRQLEERSRRERERYKMKSAWKR